MTILLIILLILLLGGGWAWTSYGPHIGGGWIGIVLLVILILYLTGNLHGVRLMPTIMLSDHFSLAEFTYSQTASREGIPNTPGAAELTNLKRLASVMEKVRTLCGSNAVTITSGYRCPELNTAIGGSAMSAHMSGLAADFVIYGYGTPYDICKRLQPHLAGLGVDQLIWEYEDWVHLGLCGEGAIPRCECLTISNAGTTNGIA